MEWKEINGFNNYLICEDGRIYSKKAKRIMSAHLMKNGYVHINLSRDNKKYGFYVHRLVAEAFIPNPNNLPQVNHIDENKENNHKANLEWCTQKYNNNHGTARERISKTLLGYENGNRIFCEENMTAYPSIKMAARELKVCKSEISRMVFHTRIVKSVHGYHFRLASEEEYQKYKMAKVKGIH